MCFLRFVLWSCNLYIGYIVEVDGLEFDIFIFLFVILKCFIEEKNKKVY